MHFQPPLSGPSCRRPVLGAVLTPVCLALALGCAAKAGATKDNRLEASSEPLRVSISVREQGEDVKVDVSALNTSSQVIYVCDHVEDRFGPDAPREGQPVIYYVGGETVILGWLPVRTPPYGIRQDIVGGDFRVCARRLGPGECATYGVTLSSVTATQASWCVSLYSHWEKEREIRRPQTGELTKWWDTARYVGAILAYWEERALLQTSGSDFARELKAEIRRGARGLINIELESIEVEDWHRLPPRSFMAAMRGGVERQRVLSRFETMTPLEFQLVAEAGPLQLPHAISVVSPPVFVVVEGNRESAGEAPVAGPE